MQLGAIHWVGDLQDARQLTVCYLQGVATVSQCGRCVRPNFTFSGDRGPSNGQAGCGCTCDGQLE